MFDLSTVSVSDSFIAMNCSMTLNFKSTISVFFVSAHFPSVVSRDGCYNLLAPVTVTLEL